jgi:hypothetical protein
MTNTLPPLVDTTATRLTLHRLAVEVLAKEQTTANGDYRLVTAPDGFATHWFAGPDEHRRRVRVAGAELIHETERESVPEPIGVDFDPVAADVLYAWWDLGARVLQSLQLEFEDRSSDVVLYPEHFDIASTIDLGASGKLNLGFSPGDEFSAEPYVYAGPWQTQAGPFWNAPFGAYRRYREIDPASAASISQGFLREAVAVLTAAAPG